MKNVPSIAPDYYVNYSYYYCDFNAGFKAIVPVLAITLFLEYDIFSVCFQIFWNY